MLLPATYALPPLGGLIMLAGIYYGAQYGGSTTAILVNLPGETSSVVTCIDGYQMARRGRAGVALSTAALGSFIAGCVGTLLLAAFAVPLASVAFKFGPAEYFSLMLLGMIGAVVLASGSLIKAIAMICLGLLGGLIGTDINTGVSRFAFDIPELSDGIGFVAVAMGVFGFAEVIKNLEQKEQREVFTSKVTSMFPTRDDFKRMAAPILRGTMLGSALGTGRLRRLFDGKKGQQAQRGIRQRGDRRSGSARVGQQCSLANLVHSAANLGNSPECRDGADGGRNDDPQHPARPASDDQQSEPVLGPDRFHVGGQPDAGGAEPADDWHLGQTVDGAVPLFVSVDPGVLLHRRVHGQQQHL
jgi:hypothetical protein